MDKFGKIRRHLWKERLKISKIAKFESDLFKTNEDIDPQSRQILQAFVWWVAQTPPPPPHQNVCKFSQLAESEIFARLRSRLRRITFKLFFLLFCNVRGLFAVVVTDFPQLVHVKSWKNREKVYSDSNLISEQLVYVHLWKGLYTTLPKKSIDIKATSQESIKVWMFTLAKLERDLVCVTFLKRRRKLSESAIKNKVGGK